MSEEKNINNDDFRDARALFEISLLEQNANAAGDTPDAYIMKGMANTKKNIFFLNKIVEGIGFAFNVLIPSPPPYNPTSRKK